MIGIGSMLLGMQEFIRLLLPYLPKLVVLVVTKPSVSRFFTTVPIERDTSGVTEALWHVI